MDSKYCECIPLEQVDFGSARSMFRPGRSVSQRATRRNLLTHNCIIRTICPFSCKDRNTIIEYNNGCTRVCESEFDNVEAQIRNTKTNPFPGTIPFDDFLWAFGVLRSRGFPKLHGYKLALIPFADLQGAHSDHSKRCRIWMTHSSHEEVKGIDSQPYYVCLLRTKFPGNVPKQILV